MQSVQAEFYVDAQSKLENREKEGSASDRYNISSRSAAVKPLSTAAPSLMALRIRDIFFAVAAFTCLNSLRDVEPQVKFIMSDGGMDGRTDESDESLPTDAIVQAEDWEESE